MQAARAEGWTARVEGAARTQPGHGGWHPLCSVARDKGTLCHSGEAGRKDRIGRSGAPQSHQVPPLGCLERCIFRLETAET